MNPSRQRMCIPQILIMSLSSARNWATYKKHNGERETEPYDGKGSLRHWPRGVLIHNGLHHAEGQDQVCMSRDRWDSELSSWDTARASWGSHPRAPQTTVNACVLLLKCHSSLHDNIPLWWDTGPENPTQPWALDPKQRLQETKAPPGERESALPPPHPPQPRARPTALRAPGWGAAWGLRGPSVSWPWG